MLFRKFVSATCVALLCGLMTTVSYGQLDGLYEFDGGGDGTSWDDAANWEQKLDPSGNPISGDPATPPDATTSADIPLLGVVLIDGTQAGQTALDVNIGTGVGGGSVFITGGDLTGRDVNVGSDGAGINIGLLSINGGSLVSNDDITLGNGSVGIMTMTGGSASTSDDFTINANSSLTVNGGDLTVGDRLIGNDNAGIIVNGGRVAAEDDFYFFDNTQVTVNGGLMEVDDKLRFDDDPSKSGKLTINGGVVRAEDFGLNITDILTDFRGEVEINGDGVLQIFQGDGSTLANLTVATAQALIDQGTILTTSEPGGLGVRSVVVPSSFQGTDVTFTEILVIPEPASMLLVGLAGLAMVCQRRRA